MMWLFGDSDFTGRLSAVSSASASSAFAWPLRRYLGRWGALCLPGAGDVLAGLDVYFTRFIRHDIYLALCNLVAVFFAFRYGETGRPSTSTSAPIGLASPSPTRRTCTS